jgi:hypothetical protein
MARTETQSAETDAPAADVLAVLTNAARIPQWAPAFADEVSGDSRSGWLVTKDGQAFTFRVAAVPAAGTVDFLREVAPGREGGAYLRVIPRPGGGSVIIMTLPVPPGAGPAATAAVLAGELAALAALAASS